MADDRVLLEHQNLASWYAQPLPEEATLQAAPDDLASLLIDDSVLATSLA